jgi:hypothetical protein
MFRIVPLSISRRFTLYTQQWHMSYRFANSFRAGSFLILLASCVQACMTYTIGVCTVKKFLMMATETVRNIDSFQSKIDKLVHLVGFITRIRHDARSHERHICHDAVT